MDVRIYNRLGEEVYQTNDPNKLEWHAQGWRTRGRGVLLHRLVRTIRLVGLVEERFSGELHLMEVLHPSE